MIKTRKLLSLLTTAALIGSLCVSPFADQTVQAKAGKVTKVSVSNLPTKNLTLKKKKKFKLKVKVKTSGKASKAVSYKSSNKKIVSVTSKGKLTAKKNGKAKITITSKANKKKKVTIKVTVGTPVSSIRFTDAKVSMKINEKKTLATTVLPTNASNKAIVWKSSNPKVATVSNGTVTALTAGTTTITALAGDGSGKKATTTITVTSASAPVAVPISSIKLNATQKTLKYNQTEQLVATIAPANATSKELKWTSSNPALVSVDKTGKIKALNDGSATITAQATDGSGKSASCIVTVTDGPIYVQSANSIGLYTAHFTLTEPFALKGANISARVKKSGAKEYGDKADISLVQSPDNLNYYVNLMSPLSIGDTIQLTVKGLRENPSTTFEMVCKKYSDKFVSYYEDHFEINKALNDVITLSGYGKCDAKIIGLPEDLQYTLTPATEKAAATINITGTPSKSGIYSFTVQYKDEIDNVYEINCTYTIYNPNKITAYTKSPYFAPNNIHNGIYVLGKWNKSTKLTFVDDNYGLIAEKNDADKCFYLKGIFTEKVSGDYPITVLIETEENGETISCEYTVTFRLTSPATIKGTIKDLTNQPVSQANISIVQINSTIPIPNQHTYQVYENGNYEFTLEEGEYYIMISSPITKIYSNPEYTVRRSKTEDYTAQLYSVEVKYPDADELATLQYKQWQSEKGYITYVSNRNEKKYIQVEPGKHTYSTFIPEEENGLGKTSTQYTISGDFNANTKSVNCIKKENVTTMGDALVLDKPQMDIPSANNIILHPFTPSESGIYFYYSDARPSFLDTAGYVFSEDGTLLYSAYYYGKDNNFALTAELEKGKTYYLGVGYAPNYQRVLQQSNILYDWDNVEHNGFPEVPIIITRTEPNLIDN